MIKNNQHFIEAVDAATRQQLLSFKCIQKGIKHQEKEDKEKAKAERLGLN